MDPEIVTKSKNTMKNERRNRCENVLLFKCFQEVPKIEQICPRCDLEPIRDQRVEPRWWTFASQGPQGTAPSTRTRQKNEGELQKEEPRKKESGKWKKGQEGSEHASGQRPCELKICMRPWIRSLSHISAKRPSGCKTFFVSYKISKTMSAPCYPMSKMV